MKELVMKAICGVCILVSALLSVSLVKNKRNNKKAQKEISRLSTELTNQKTATFEAQSKTDVQQELSAILVKTLTSQAKKDAQGGILSEQAKNVKTEADAIAVALEQVKRNQGGSV